MENTAKNIIRSLGVIDIMVGLHQASIEGGGTFYYILLGLLYIISGSQFLFFKERWRKIFMFGAIPLSILASFHMIRLCIGKTHYFYNSIERGLLMIVLATALPLLLNLVILVHPRMKEHFKPGEKMEGERPTGVMVFAIFNIIIGILGILVSWFFWFGSGFCTVSAKYAFTNSLIWWNSLLLFISWIIFLVYSCGLFSLREKARRRLFFSAWFILFTSIPLYFLVGKSLFYVLSGSYRLGIILLIANIIYFTRPGVGEQFKK